MPNHLVVSMKLNKTFFLAEKVKIQPAFFFLDKYKYLAIKTKTISFLIQDLLSQKEYTWHCLVEKWDRD